MSTPEACRGRTAGYARLPLTDRPAASVRMGFGACQLVPEGHITRAPQPPRHHSYRFNRDWDYLEQVLRMR
jgi:hypothetical protein